MGMGAGTGRKTADLLETLAGRIAVEPQGRTASAFLASVAQVHALIRDLRPTPEEWRGLLEFLTEVGHASDARRQEWVLLSDVIGASSLIEDQHQPHPPGTTPGTLPGPFYRADVPQTPNGADLSRDGIGVPLTVTGRVSGPEGEGIARAQVEVWQANSFGVYENQQPDLQPEYNLRGRFLTEASGAFHFRSVCPRGYSLPEDGPVGRLLNRIGIKLERPAHLHFRVTAPGFQDLTTHIYDRADPAIDRDALFCVKPELLGDFRPDPDRGPPARLLTVSLVLARAGATPDPVTSRTGA